MSVGKKKIGRPLLNEPEREELKMINFKADKATMAALDKLESAVESGVVVGRRSVAIRRALQLAAKTGTSK